MLKTVNRHFEENLPERGSVTRSTPSWMNLWTILGVAVVLYAIRMAGPSDLADDYHQERAAAYVMDALRNGNWICQYGYYGEVSSKPPMLTWLAALASLPFGGANWFSLSLPGALATMVLAALIFTVGSQQFGRTAGFLGALMYLLSPIGAKQMVQVRIDGLFSLTIAVTALLAFRAWQTGRGWTWFWLAGAVSTLTKGPWGVLLGAVGLLAAIRGRSIKGNHLPGVILYLVICGGWFALAYMKFGKPLIDVMFGQELAGHLLEDSRTKPFAQLYSPTVVFLSRFAPWSLLTCVGLWRAFRGGTEFERFVSCWFLGGLVIFSCAAHQRPDLIFPLIPAAALLAGRVLAPWLERRTWLVPVGTALVLIGFGYNYIVKIKDRPRFQRTAAVKELANLIKSAGVQVKHVDTPYALQVYLNTKQLPIDATKAANLLTQPPPVFIATSQTLPVTNMYVLYRWRGPKQEMLELVSNRSRLARD